MGIENLWGRGGDGSDKRSADSGAAGSANEPASNSIEGELTIDDVVDFDDDQELTDHDDAPSSSGEAVREAIAATNNRAETVAGYSVESVSAVADRPTGVAADVGDDAQADIGGAAHASTSGVKRGNRTLSSVDSKKNLSVHNDNHGASNSEQQSGAIETVGSSTEPAQTDADVDAPRQDGSGVETFEERVVVAQGVTETGEVEHVVVGEVAITESETGVPEAADTAAGVGGGSPPADLSEEDPADGYDDGSHRRKRAMVIVAVALLAAALGMLIGSRIQSPADRAAGQGPPKPSLITTPVLKQELAAQTTFNGTVGYATPVAVQIAGPVGIEPDDKSIVTAIPKVGEQVNEGTRLLTVTSRPVFVLQGGVPMYRKITIGSVGPDVKALEEALKRLKFDPGKVDETADGATMAAVAKMYRAAGFEPASATDQEATTLRTAQRAYDEAKRQTQGAGMKPSEKLELDRAVATARAAIPEAERGVGSAKAQQDAAVAQAEGEVTSAKGALDSATSAYNKAKGGAKNPETGKAYTAAEIAALKSAVDGAQATLNTSRASLRSANAAREDALVAARKAVDEARYNLQLAETRLREGGSSSESGNSGAGGATSIKDAEQDLAKAQIAAAVRVPAGEIIFSPALPGKVTEWTAKIGAEATGSLGTIASSTTRVTAPIGQADLAAVPAGTQVSIELREANESLGGKVVGTEPLNTAQGGQGGQGEQGGGESNGGGASNDGRQQLVVLPDDPTKLESYVNQSAQIVATSKRTKGAALVVPAAALSTGQNNQSRVEVERQPATKDKEAVTEFVNVDVNLSANGLAAITPKKNADGTMPSLKAGDRVVIGFAYADRAGSAGGQTAGGAPSDSKTTTSDASNSDAAKSDEKSEPDSNEEASPLEKYFGVSSSPVAIRKQELKVEEATATCMKEKGFKYVPVDNSGSSGGQAAEEKNFDEKYGYGVVFAYETRQKAMSGEGFDQMEETKDPNEDYMNGLSTQQRAEYEKALNGEPYPMTTDEASIKPRTWQEKGCRGKARHDVAGDNPFDNAKFAKRFDEISTEVSKSPEAQKFNAAWAECMKAPMKKNGLDTEPKAIGDGLVGVQNKLGTLQGLTSVAVTSPEQLNELQNKPDFVDGQYFPETQSGFAFLGTAKPLSADQIAQLQKTEVAVFKADQECQKQNGFAEFKKAQDQKIVERLRSEFPSGGKQ